MDFSAKYFIETYFGIIYQHKPTHNWQNVSKIIQQNLNR